MFNEWYLCSLYVIRVVVGIDYVCHRLLRDFPELSEDFRRSFDTFRHVDDDDPSVSNYHDGVGQRISNRHVYSICNLKINFDHE